MRIGLKVAEIKNRVWVPLGVYQFALKCNRSSFSLIFKEANGKDEPFKKEISFCVQQGYTESVLIKKGYRFVISYRSITIWSELKCSQASVDFMFQNQLTHTQVTNMF